MKAQVESFNRHLCFISIGSIDRVGLTPITALLDTYGKWPLITSNWSEADFDWRKASAAVASIFDIGVFFEVSNFLDANDTSKQAIYVFKLLLNATTDRLTLIFLYVFSWISQSSEFRLVF